MSATKKKALARAISPEAQTTSATLAKPDAATRTRLAVAYGELPLSFEANQGQSDPRVKFLSRTKGYILFLTATEAVLSLDKGQGAGADASRQIAPPNPTGKAVLRVRLIGANSQAQIVGLDELPGKINYFRSSNPTQRLINVPSSARVRYVEVYPGVDLVYYGSQRQVEYDFVTRPGADLQAIRLAFEGADRLGVDSRGDLLVQTAAGDLRQPKPLVYQEVGGVRRTIAGDYVVTGPLEVGFRVGTYDPTLPLVIDPVLVYSTYLGGSGRGDRGSGIAVDAAGNAYVTGGTDSTNFPTKNPLQPTFSGGSRDTFVAKLNAAGTALV